MSTEMADYIQIFLLAMIVCHFMLNEVQRGHEAAESIGRAPDNYFLSFAIGLVINVIFLAVATAFVLGIAFGIWWFGTRVFDFLIATNFLTGSLPT